MTPSCLTILQNTIEGLEQDSKNLDILVQVLDTFLLLSLCGDLLFNMGLTENEESTLCSRVQWCFAKAFNFMVPSGIFLLVLQGLFWVGRNFGGFFGGHSYPLKKDSHVHFIWIFFRAFYFIVKALLDFIRASVQKCPGEGFFLNFRLHPLLVPNTDLLCIILHPKLCFSIPFILKKKNYLYLLIIKAPKL